MLGPPPSPTPWWSPPPPLWAGGCWECISPYMSNALRGSLLRQCTHPQRATAIPCQSVAMGPELPATSDDPPHPSTLHEAVSHPSQPLKRVKMGGGYHGRGRGGDLQSWILGHIYICKYI